MDRQIVYNGQIPLETDLLNAEKNAYVALSKLAAAIIGNGPAAHGFDVTGSSTSLTVTVAAGEFYMQSETDTSVYSSLPADATVILKQGILPAATTLTLPTPTSWASGQSVVYLVQVGLSETDTNPETLAYFNPTAPYTPLNGPSGSGSAQATTRNDAAVISVVTGTVYATNTTPVIPGPSSGCMGLATVTVAYGESNSTNIAQYSGATWLNETLADKISLATGLENFAALNSPVFTGTPQAPTPSSLDNSATVATTAFTRAVGHNASTVYSATSSVTLPSSVFGGDVYVPVGNSSVTLTLPSASAAAIGQGIQFVNQSGEKVTLLAAGTDSIALPNNASAVGTLIAGPGDNVMLSVSASGNWLATTGSALLNNSNQFASQLASNGYQCLPSGLIMQWGIYTLTGSSSDTITFAKAFPAACVGVFTTPDGTDNGLYEISVYGRSATNFSFRRRNNTSANTVDDTSVNFVWFAIGY